MDKENKKQDNSDKKLNFASKISSSFSSAINSIDSKINPKVGKYFHKLFKTLTFLLLIAVIPLFVLFYQFSMIDDVASFKTIYLSKVMTESLEESYISNSFEQTFTYEEIDKSIEDSYNTDSFVNTIFDTSINEGEVRLFYTYFVSFDPSKISESAYYETSILPIDDSIQSMKDINIPVSEGEVPISLSELFGKPESVEPKEVLAYKIGQRNGESPMNYENVDAAQKGFRTAFGVSGATTKDEKVSKIGFIVSWSLLGAAVLTWILTFWFSKFSEVPLKSKKNGEEKNG